MIYQVYNYINFVQIYMYSKPLNYSIRQVYHVLICAHDYNIQHDPWLQPIIENISMYIVHKFSQNIGDKIC